jgi:hypothetical protein
MGKATAAGRLRGRRRARVRRPVRPHLGADEPAPGADHAGTQRPHHGFVRQPVGIEPGAVVALDGIAIDEDVPAAEGAHLPERNGREWRAGARGHGTRLPACLACGPDRVTPRRCRRLKSIMRPNRTLAARSRFNLKRSRSSLILSSPCVRAMTDHGAVHDGR